MSPIIYCNTIVFLSILNKARNRNFGSFRIQQRYVISLFLCIELTVALSSKNAKDN